jgi:hypothetical protein
MSRVYFDKLHAHKIISAKTDMFCTMCKKVKKYLEKSVYVKLYVHTYNIFLYMQNLFLKIFKLLKYVLYIPDTRCICTWDQF